MTGLVIILAGLAAMIFCDVVAKYRPAMACLWEYRALWSVRLVALGAVIAALETWWWVW